MIKFLKFFAVMCFATVAVTCLDVFIQLFLQYLLYALVFGFEILVSCFVVARLTASRIRRSVPDQLNQFLTLFAVLCLPLMGCLLSAPHWLRLSMQGDPTDILAEGAKVGAVVGFFVGMKILSDDLKQEAVLKQAQVAIAEARRLMGLEQYQDADEKLREAMVASELQFGSNHEEPARLSEALAELFQESNEPEKAAAMHRRALSIYEHLLGNRHPKVAECIVNMAQLEGVESAPDGTIVLLRRALGISEQELGSTHPLVGSVVQALSELLARKERWGEAEDTARRALEITKKQITSEGQSLSSDPLSSSTTRMLAADRAAEMNLRTGRLALILAHTGRMGEAERLINEALKQREQMELPATKDTVWMLLELSRIHTQHGKKEQAGQRILEALRCLQSSVGPGHPAVKEIFELGIPVLTALLPQPETGELYAGILKADSMALRKKVEANPKLVTSPDVTGWQPLQWAVFLGLDRVTDTLIFAGATMEATDWPPLHIATRWNQRRIVPALLTKGADASSLTADGCTLLHQCALAGDERLIDTLISKGAPVGAINREGLSALHIGARDGHTRVVVELVARQADIKQPNKKNGWSALHYACAGGHLAIVECLLLNGADVQQLTLAGKTAAALAHDSGHPNVVEVLKAHSR